MSNPFFKNHGPLRMSMVIKSLELNENSFNKDEQIKDIKDLHSSEENDISFFHSKKYKDFAHKTKASFCLTTKALKNELPKNSAPGRPLPRKTYASEALAERLSS